MSNFVKTLLISALGAVFVATGFNVQSANATGDHNATCVDATKRSNLSVTWVSANKVQVKTLTGMPVCKDTPLYFSSYVMPDNYNGKPFTDNPTASPQQMFSSVSVVLKANATSNATLETTLPEACKHVQIDLYYAPEIVTVTAKGHGDQYITGKIYTKTKDVCVPPTPEKPEEPKKPEVPKEEAQTPPTPAPEVKVVAPVKQVALPETGTNLGALIATGVAISAAAYATVYAFNKR